MRKAMVDRILNIRCALATWMALPPPNDWIRAEKDGRNGRMITTPIKLNKKWATAVRLAPVPITNMAIRAVEVVPTFAPSTIPKAWSKLSKPWLVRMMATPEVMLEDWKATVTSAPTSIATYTLFICDSKSIIVGLDWSGSMYKEMSERQKKIKPK